MAELQAMVTQQQMEMALRIADTKRLEEQLAKEKADRKIELAKEKADRKMELAKEKVDRIAETNKLEEQLEKQKDETDQLVKDLQSKQDRLTKEMREHAADMKSISEVQKFLPIYN